MENYNLPVLKVTNPEYVEILEWTSGGMGIPHMDKGIRIWNVPDLIYTLENYELDEGCRYRPVNLLAELHRLPIDKIIYVEFNK